MGGLSKIYRKRERKMCERKRDNEREKESERKRMAFKQ